MEGSLSAFTAIICFLINVISQVILCRFFSRVGLLKSIFLGFVIGMGFLCVLESRAWMNPQGLDGESIGLTAVHILTYAALGYGYFHFLNLGETSRRIRIIQELFESPGGLTEEEILSRYNARMITQMRMERLLKSGQIRLENDRYFIHHPVMAGMARILLLMQTALGPRK